MRACFPGYERACPCAGRLALAPAALCVTVVKRKSPQTFFLSCSQPQSLRAQHSSFTRARGGQASRAVGEGREGKDAHCCPDSCTGMIMWSSPRGRWDEWGLPGGGPYCGEILRRTKNNSYLRQDKKFQHKIFSVHWASSLPLECTEYLQYVLTNLSAQP